MPVLEYSKNVLRYDTSILNYDGIEYIPDYDGNLYSYSSFGDFTVMHQNLRVTHLNDGTPISIIEDDDDWYRDGNSVSMTWYGNDPSNAVPYGGLYKWECVSTGLLAIPGWHVPSNAEIRALRDQLYGPAYAGGHLKVTGTEYWATAGASYTPPVGIGYNIGATNYSGLSYYPTGWREYNGQFYNLSEFGYYWTSDYFKVEDFDYVGYYYRLSAGNAYLAGPSPLGTSPYTGFSVRLFKD
jgi:uncharacterized protein (TIGR02145 family)